MTNQSQMVPLSCEISYFQTLVLSFRLILQTAPGCGYSSCSCSTCRKRLLLRGPGTRQRKHWKYMDRFKQGVQVLQIEVESVIVLLVSPHEALSKDTCALCSSTTPARPVCFGLATIGRVQLVMYARWSDLNRSLSKYENTTINGLLAR